MFQCWSKGLSFCLKGKKIARFHTRRVLPPRAPLLRYGLEALRLWVLLPKSSRIPYEAGLAPRAPLLRRCFMEYRAALPKTPERNVTFPPHPPNTVRRLLLEEMALLPRPSYLHNSSLHKLRYVMANKHRIRHCAQHRAIFSPRGRLCYLVQLVYIIQLT